MESLNYKNTYGLFLYKPLIKIETFLINPLKPNH